MYRFLLSRQWVILTLLGLVLIPVMIKLGFWQLHRHESRVARNEEVAASLAAPTVPVTELTGVGREPAADEKFRTVTAHGRYDTEHEVVVRHRTAADGDTIGYFVVTPLVLDDGKAILVNRGWIRSEGDLTSFPKVPEPPRGEVTVTGRMMPDETTEASGIKDTKGLPDRQVMLINSKKQAGDVGRPMLGGFVQLMETKPQPNGKQPEVLPEPDHSGIGPHMAYAIQWWLFTGAVPVGWVVLVRREAKERRERAAAGETAATGEQPGDEEPDAEKEPGKPEEPEKVTT
ncbi:SURF1 family cytochrome oxidase biogenesis protein [Streptomyces albus]|uniref:SURF1 family cytochrome oxidase biogenesis protein n=1 Tax=Streptomyces sp. NRRL F-5639 TaxID=1463867 RepID=UPI0004C79913|nr:SURF1 family protein [Streptomyces sp. NRRL F-5639]KPC93561.1 membrane protein [Streptomyces sp. NRRL F-6602]